ncbi:MAG: SDR family NAD(P)-dependent oxidoreductase [Candidatus Pelagibacterales bacterium]|jgi:NAD(P)-dependent dehydrogenase (short-subunit alcohol dehydrogenase family)|tara:strand:- start:2332 stop:3105 length:774 start_codon:yes stop_codon:yes gene_type:complete
MSTLFNLSGKKAIITGSSKGIGKATAMRMAEHGAKVVITSRKIDACIEVANEINNKYGSDTAMAMACNISDKEQLEKLHSTSVDWCGDIDILVCNAAINPYFGPSLNTPDSAFEKIMRSNVQSNFWLSNMVLPTMIKNKSGSIIIISSIAGLHGSSLLGAYAISKAADSQLARNISVEHGPHGIRANCISPGLIKTDFARALWENESILKTHTSKSALKRIGLPDEIAGAVIFLASEAGSFTTGQNIVIDGGEGETV